MLTTQKEGQRLKEAYRLALASRDVARHRDDFRYGRVVRFKIPWDFGFSDGLSAKDRAALSGDFQLRYGPTDRPDGKSDHYSVWGRVSGNLLDPDGWIPIDGPWKVGEGPFDNRGTGRPRGREPLPQGLLP